MNRAELKQKARYSLISNFGETLKVLLLYLVIAFVSSFTISFAITFVDSFSKLSGEVVALIAYVAITAVIGLIYFGFNSFFLKVARDEEVTYKELFSKPKMVWSYISISLLIGLFTSLWTFLLIIPGIIASINYSIAYFVKLDNPELGAMDVLRKSKEIMDGHKWDFFVLMLSFLVWYIIGLFTFGLLYLWLIPYMQITFVNFYDEIKD